MPFEGRTIPVVGCAALIVFKAILDRGKDWADIEAMVESGNVNVAAALASLEEMVGSDSPRAQRLVALAP